MSESDRSKMREAWRESWIELLAYADSLEERSGIRTGPQMNIIQELLERVEKAESGTSKPA